MIFDTIEKAIDYAVANGLRPEFYTIVRSEDGRWKLNREEPAGLFLRVSAQKES